MKISCTYIDGDARHKGKLTYSGGTGTTGELCYDICVSKDLTLMLNFLTRIPGCDIYTPALLDLFISSKAKAT